MTRILLLGGTTEASQLAACLAATDVDAVFSYAGRTNSPLSQPLPTRVGGFGGVAGLAAYIGAENISHVIDATHPFAAMISGNAYAACIQTRTPLLSFQRPAWTARRGDHWLAVADMEAAVAALPITGARVFLAIGKQTLAAFATKPLNHYMLRLVDPPAHPLPLPEATVIVARGPFDAAGDTVLLRDHAITHIVAKNAGGAGAAAKLMAARTLGLPVIMIDRPAAPKRDDCATTDGVMDWLAHHGAIAARGV
jgi:precorrin-6A/cobalt-precorrin-6A reductase